MEKPGKNAPARFKPEKKCNFRSNFFHKENVLLLTNDKFCIHYVTYIIFHSFIYFFPKLFVLTLFAFI